MANDILVNKEIDMKVLKGGAVGLGNITFGVSNGQQGTIGKGNFCPDSRRGSGSVEENIKEIKGNIHIKAENYDIGVVF